MKDTEIVSMSERELEDILEKNPEKLMEGAVSLRRQFSTDTGPLDMLILDTEGTIWVAELKVEPDDSHLDQGLRYYDYIRINIESLVRTFHAEGQKVDIYKEPGLLLVSTSFSPHVLCIVKYVSIPVELVEAIPIEESTGKRTVVCRSIEYGAPQEPLEVATENGHISSIDDNTVRDFASKLIGDLKKRGLGMRVAKHNWFTFYHSGRHFISIGCRKKYLSVYIKNPEGEWSDIKQIDSKQDWDIHVEPLIAEVLQE